MRTETCKSVEAAPAESAPGTHCRDYEQISAELIRCWRGKRTLAAFSRRLGSKSTMVHNWEAKRRWPTAARALWAAERCGVDLVEAMTRFYGQPPAWLGGTVPATPRGVQALLADCVGMTPLTHVARRAGRSRFAVARWVSGKSEPRLPDFLRLIDAASLRLIDFLGTLADPAQMPSVAVDWGQLQLARRVAYEAPWSHAVLRALELEQYVRAPAHDDAVLAHALGIDEAAVRQALDLLLAAGQIRLEDGHYASISSPNVDTRADKAANARLKQWWTEVAAERMRQGTAGQFSYNVFSVSRDDFEAIRALQLRYFRELRAIVAASQPSQCVAVVNLHLLDLGALPEPPSTPFSSAPRGAVAKAKRAKVILRPGNDRGQ